MVKISTHTKSEFQQMEHKENGGYKQDIGKSLMVLIQKK